MISGHNKTIKTSIVNATGFTNKAGLNGCESLTSSTFLPGTATHIKLI